MLVPFLYATKIPPKERRFATRYDPLEKREAIDAATIIVASCYQKRPAGRVMASRFVQALRRGDGGQAAVLFRECDWELRFHLIIALESCGLRLRVAEAAAGTLIRDTPSRPDAADQLSRLLESYRNTA